ncbi:MAG: group III truncated hemoglobin [Limnohabitans sp.]|nr:group III truncated hemoglobin [Limnohabitans sp.]
MKNDIQNREDIFRLVCLFYDKIKANDEIGPFFIETIEDWDNHLEKLTNFWENNLFDVRKYFGNPLEEHVKVDERFNGIISPNLFGLWLNLWFESLEELFEGENVELLKRRARKMGTFLMIRIFESRNNRNQ